MFNWMPNKNEQQLILKIEAAKKYCKGELEFDLFEDGWFAMDYREDFEAAFFIEENQCIKKPMITEEDARKYDIDVIKCLDYCDVSYVG